MKNNVSRFIYVLAAAFLVIAIFASCKKEKGLSRTELLSRSWKLVDLIAAANGMSQSIFSTEIDPCSQDDIYEFANTGTFMVKSGVTKCDPADPDIHTTGTWQFIDNETRIIVDPSDDDAYTGNIDEISKTTLKISTSEINNGITFTITSIFQAQ